MEYKRRLKAPDGQMMWLSLDEGKDGDRSAVVVLNYDGADIRVCAHGFLRDGETVEDWMETRGMVPA